MAWRMEGRGFMRMIVGAHQPATSGSTRRIAFFSLDRSPGRCQRQLQSKSLARKILDILNNRVCFTKG